MCLMLYLGTERPIIAAQRLGPLAAARIAHEAAPTALRDQASIYQIGSRLSHARPLGPAAAPSWSDDGAAMGGSGTDRSPGAAAEPAPARADEDRLGCACVFRETGCSDSLGAYAALRALMGEILSAPRDAATLLGCWSGDEALAPAVEMAVSVAEISEEIEFFSDVIHGWPILLRVTAPTAARRVVAAGDR